MPGIPFAHRRLMRAGSCCLLATALAACDPSGLLVDAAPPPGSGSLSLSVGPSPGAQPGTVAAFSAANRLRVQLVSGNAVVLDTVLDFGAGDSEVLIPIDPSLTPGVVHVEVELRENRQSLLRGSQTIQLHQRQITTVEIDLDPVSFAPLASVAQLSAGILHSCAVRADGRAVCWGDNLFGHLGDGFSAGMRVTPAAVVGGLRFQHVAAGYVTSCGLGTDQRIYCWGENDRGALGTTSTARSSSPVPVAGNLAFQQLVMGGLHACGLTTAGQAFCWGYNEFGQLGDGSTTDRSGPTASGGALRFVSLSAGYLHTCGLATNGVAYCWGHNERGQLGDGSQSHTSTPVRVADGHGFTALAAGGLHTCGRLADGRVYCWGYNAFGQLGMGTGAESQSTPAAVAGGIRFSSLTAGGAHTCGLAQDSQVYCWGYNHSGPVGTGTFSNVDQPAAVLGGLRARQVAAGLHHTCALTLDSQAMCWGFNRFGQLGDRSTVNSAEPGFVSDEDSSPFSAAPRPSLYPPDALRMLPGPGH